MYIVMVGAGKVGKHLVRMLLHQGHHVALIEQEAERCELLAGELPARVVQGDGTSVQTLAEAGADRADVVVAVTGFDEENLVVCRMAKEFFNVPRTVARVNNPSNEEIFRRLGIDQAVSVTSVIADLIEETASVDELLPLRYLESGRVEMVEIHLNGSSPVIGQQVAEVGTHLPEGVVFASILREGHVVVPRGDTIFEAGDAVLAITELDREAELRTLLLGRK